MWHLAISQRLKNRAKVVLFSGFFSMLTLTYLVWWYKESLRLSAYLSFCYFVLLCGSYPPILCRSGWFVAVCYCKVMSSTIVHSVVGWPHRLDTSPLLEAIGGQNTHHLLVEAGSRDLILGSYWSIWTILCLWH